jgi:hypothetical protein
MGAVSSYTHSLMSKASLGLDALQPAYVFEVLKYFKWEVTTQPPKSPM